MRAVIAFAILLLGISSAAPEADYSSYSDGNLVATITDDTPSLVEIESSTGRADRLPVPSPQAPETQRDANTVATLTFDAPGDAETDTAQNNDLSLDDLCNALFSSAQNNDLPIPFFANLIWQESRLRDDAVSKKGALGIAQFMPQTAAETGLDDPFDPRQAIPASARFLRDLRLEFGNLGFVAAAYNAGAHRVIAWLEHRASLPRETRGYVVRVTGLSVDDWRKMAIDDEALTFVRHLPCRSLPAFASVEEAQSEQVRVQQAKLEQLKQVQAEADLAAAKHTARKAGKTATKTASKTAAKSKTGARRRIVAREHDDGVKARQETHQEARRPAPAHDRSNNRQAEGRSHGPRGKHNSV